jgi:RNA polymerase sigma-70 factor (ECF subfamily)
MNTRSDDTSGLVRKAVAGDGAAIEELFARHRSQLTRMIAVRLDPRLKGRLDPSDIVQDVLVEASQKMATELAGKPVEFYPWLRGLAWDRLCRLHRHHVTAQKRSVAREEALAPPAEVDDESVLKLAECIAASGGGPGSQVMHEELRRRVREALTRLPAKDREIIVLRFLEQLSTKDAADVLGISLTAAKSRQLRAIARLQDFLGDLSSEASR